MFQTAEFWVAIGFVILIAGIARPVGRGVCAALDARGEKIRASLDEATRLREEAQHLLAEYKRKQRNAAKECEELVTRAEAEAKRLSLEATEKMEAALERRKEHAIDKIAQAEAEALQQVREATVDVAVAATRKLLTDKLDQTQANALIGAAIAELPNKLN